MTENPSEEFFRIVERLDLDMPEPEPEPDYRSVHPSGLKFGAARSGEGATGPQTVKGRRRVLAWYAVAGPPLLLVLATLGGWILPRQIVLAAVLIFAAGSIYLISQLPEHGPGQSDWPDDGAVL